MGRSTTPTYRLETEGGDFGGMRTWRGRATVDRLERYLVDMSRSSGVGGANGHIGAALGRIMRLPRVARIVHQSSGRVVAEWKHPPFFAY